MTELNRLAGKKMKALVTSIFLYAWFAQGVFVLLKPDLILSEVFSNKPELGYDECKILVQVIGILVVCLSLMTCPNPHGYWMATILLAGAAAKFHFVDGIAPSEEKQLAVVGVLAVPVVLSTLAVLTCKPNDTKPKAKKK